MKVFYHGDPDGQAAAYWIRRLVDGGEKTEFFPASYDKPLPLEKIAPGEPVYLVDFSIKPDTMRELLRTTEAVVWIDHHKTALEAYQGFEVPIAGIRRDGVAGCVLTWLFLTAENPEDAWDPSRLSDVPLFTTLIGDRDIWAFKCGRTTENLFAALLAEDRDPASDLWPRLEAAGDDLSYWLDRGKVINEYLAQANAEYLESFGFEAELDGFPVIALNSGRKGSEIFASSKKSYPIEVVFVWDGDRWQFSLYSKSVDVGEIAAKRGGGGHKGAAGFAADELPFGPKIEQKAAQRPPLSEGLLAEGRLFVKQDEPSGLLVEGRLFEPRGEEK